MPEQPSPRRRFQFRLRTLLIGVTLLAVPLAYVGWQAKIVRERHAILKAPPMESFYPSVKTTPLVRRWLGDLDLSEIVMGVNATEEEMARFRAAFPEAVVRRIDSPPPPADSR